MGIWIVLIGISAFIGWLCSKWIKAPWGIYCAAIIPWLCLLLVLIYSEYYIANEPIDSSMWIIAQIFGGTVAAAVGAVTYRYFKP